VVTLDDIVAAVVARCTASSAFAAALPGGLHHDRGPESPTGAWGLLALERAGEPEFESDGTYLQEWTLRIVAYTVQGLAADYSQPQAGAVGASQAAQLALAAAMNTGPTTWAALRDGRVNVCLPRGYDGKHAPELREGKDVFAAAGQWSLLIEGNRA
jgi:hypothetical protein